MTYSRMGKPHTTIGAERFHFRVRNGIGWFPLAMAARQTGVSAVWRGGMDSGSPGQAGAMRHGTATPNRLGVIWSSLTVN